MIDGQLIDTAWGTLTLASKTSGDFGFPIGTGSQSFSLLPGSYELVYSNQDGIEETPPAPPEPVNVRAVLGCLEVTAP